METRGTTLNLAFKAPLSLMDPYPLRAPDLTLRSGHKDIGLGELRGTKGSGASRVKTAVTAVANVGT